MNEPMEVKTHSRSESVEVSVIAPCLNEEANIQLLVERTLATFDRSGIAGELVLVDDGSTDRTWEEILTCSRRDTRVRGIRHTVNQGMEGAWKSGLHAACGSLLCLIDADLQNRPEDIAELYAAYRERKTDIVQAVRHPVEGARRCLAFSRGLNLLLNLTFGMGMRDSKSGFILTKREVLERILTHRYRYRYFQCFIGAAANVQGYTVAEIDTDFNGRHGGESFLSRLPIGVSLRALWELIKYRVETLAVTNARVAHVSDTCPLSAPLAGTTGSES